MIIGIGVDIVKTARIEKSLDRFGDSFAAKILSPSEMTDYANKSNKANFVAKRFAAKEAVSKALGTGMGAGVHFHQITVTNKPSGAPQLTLEGAAQKRADKLGVTSIHLSLSDELDGALAFVVLES